MRGHTTSYGELDEMQADLDEYLETHNTKRSHPGRKMNGRTPFTVFKVGTPKVLKVAAATPNPEVDQKAA